MLCLDDQVVILDGHRVIHESKNANKDGVNSKIDISIIIILVRN